MTISLLTTVYVRLEDHRAKNHAATCSTSMTDHTIKSAYRDQCDDGREGLTLTTANQRTVFMMNNMFAQWWIEDVSHQVTKVPLLFLSSLSVLIVWWWLLFSTQQHLLVLAATSHIGLLIIVVLSFSRLICLSESGNVTVAVHLSFSSILAEICSQWNKTSLLFSRCPAC